MLKNKKRRRRRLKPSSQGDIKWELRRAFLSRGKERDFILFLQATSLPEQNNNDDREILAVWGRCSSSWQADLTSTSPLQHMRNGAGNSIASHVPWCSSQRDFHTSTVTDDCLAFHLTTRVYMVQYFCCCCLPGGKQCTLIQIHCHCLHKSSECVDIAPPAGGPLTRWKTFKEQIPHRITRVEKKNATALIWSERFKYVARPVTPQSVTLK